MDQLGLFGSTKLRREFEAFHRDNPSVWLLFERFTYAVIRRGHKRYSARTVIHRIRWHTDVETTTYATGFKINNNHSPYYSRMWDEKHPEHAGFFEQRIVKGGNDVQ